MSEEAPIVHSNISCSSLHIDTLEVASSLGTAGQYLGIDTSGTLGWSTPAGSGSAAVYAKAELSSAYQVPTDTVWRTVNNFTAILQSHSNSISTSGFTAPRAGVYMVAFKVFFATNNVSNAIGPVSTRIRHNTTVISESSNGNNDGPKAYVSNSDSVMVSLASGDTITPEYLLVNKTGTAIQLSTAGTHLSIWNVD